MMISVFDQVENIKGLGENAHVIGIFSFAHNVFKHFLAEGC